MNAAVPNATRGALVWSELTDEDVLAGQLHLDRPSRLGRYTGCPGLHADLHVCADSTGRIVLRVPEAVAPTPEQFAELEDIDEVWGPVMDPEGGLVGGRGLLHYHTLVLPGHQIFLEITVEEKPFGCCA